MHSLLLAITLKFIKFNVTFPDLHARGTLLREPGTIELKASNSNSVVESVKE